MRPVHEKAFLAWPSRHAMTNRHIRVRDVGFATPAPLYEEGRSAAGPFMRFILFLVIAVWAAVVASLAQAASSEPFRGDHMTARLIVAEDGVREGAASLSAGLDVELEAGWHTYWREPGEVGLPPELDWSQSENVAGVELMFPRPIRFTAFDIEQVGYEDEVVYPLRVALERPGEPATLRANATVLVCREVCIPEVFSLALDLSAGGGVDREAAARIARFAETVGELPSDAIAVSAARSLALYAALAFLGGFILNFMPCVLPVLAIKLGSAIRSQQDGRRRIRMGFLASAAGVMAFVLGLAAVLAALKASGALVGWGMQFQSPLFLTFVVVLLGVFAASMFGLFEIRLPSALNARMGSLGSGGSATGAGSGYAGDFATGAFAALLATPCSAPFLGTAVAFALAGGAVETFVVFAALGLGLALPYLLVAVFPALVRLLPRPGRWMETLRLVLGAALAATALWLLWVLAGVAGWAVALLVGIAVALAMALAALPVGRIPWRGAAATALLLAAFAAPSLLAAPAPRDVSDHIWTAFDADGIGREVARGRTVFVDVTADWCLTCKVNKSAVLSLADVEAALSGDAIVAMRADWTRPNEAILRYLKRNRRSGIPFNAVYGPGAPEGIVLSELLTRGAVLGAIERAGGS